MSSDCHFHKWDQALGGRDPNGTEFDQTQVEERGGEEEGDAPWILPVHFRRSKGAEYRLKLMLGRGQYGETWEVEDKEKQCRAMKIVRKRRGMGAGIIEALKNEVESLLLLRGVQGVAQLIDLFEERKRLCLVMELCKGGELLDVLVERGTFSEKEVADVAHAALTTLGDIHQRHICHRDVKPENLVFKEPPPPRGRGLNIFASRRSFATPSSLVLIDFGMSTTFLNGVKMTKCMGSAMYMAPEVFKQSYNADCDVWSLGICLYLLLSGRPPFEGSDTASIFRRVLGSEPDFVSAPWGRVSKKAKSFIAALLAKDPEKRLSVKEALNHPFISKRASADSTPVPIKHNKIRSFVASGRLHAAYLKHVLSTLPDDQFAAIQKQIDNSQEGTGTSPNNNNNIDGDAVSPNTKIRLRSESFSRRDPVLLSMVLDQESLLREAFRSLDLEHTGNLNRRELRQLVEAQVSTSPLLGREASVMEEVDAILESVDVSGDEVISYEEFRQAITHHLTCNPGTMQ